MEGRRKVGSMAGQKKLVVVVINIGTYMTDFAVSFQHDPANLTTPIWAPTTCILLNKEKKFVAYGNEAKEQYNTLCNAEKEMDYYFFQKFKTDLFNSLINPTINDVTGKSMSPIKVLSASIEHVRKLIVQLGSQIELNEDDLWVVLVVPEILKKPHTITSIRHAARNAGAKDERFLLISEPEAACIWCHHLYKDVLKYDKHDCPLQTKTDTIVVDTGCEIDTTLGYYAVVDVTVTVIRTDNNPEDLMQHKSWQLGRNPVDQHYRDFLYEVFGTYVMDEFKQMNSDEYEHMFLLYHVKLRNFTDNEKHVNLRMPCKLIELFERRRGVSFNDYVKSNSSLSLPRRDILKVLDKKGTSLITVAFENIIDGLKLVLQKSQMTNVPTIVLYGWLAESPKFQILVQESFPEKRIIIPNKPPRAVMKGAALFAHGAARSVVEAKLEPRKHKRFSEK